MKNEVKGQKEMKAMKENNREMNHAKDNKGSKDMNHKKDQKDSKDMKDKKEMKSTKGTKGLKAFLAGAFLVGASAIGLQAEASPDMSKPVMVVGEVGVQDKDFFIRQGEMRFGTEAAQYFVQRADLSLGDAQMVIGDINGDKDSHSIEAELKSLAGEPIVVRGYQDTKNANEIYVYSINGIEYKNPELMRGNERKSDNN